MGRGALVYGTLGCSRDLVRGLSSLPHGVSYGLLWGGLIGDTKWAYY